MTPKEEECLPLPWITALIRAVSVAELIIIEGAWYITATVIGQGSANAHSVPSSTPILWLCITMCGYIARILVTVQSQAVRVFYSL